MPEIRRLVNRVYIEHPRGTYFESLSERVLFFSSVGIWSPSSPIMEMDPNEYKPPLLIKTSHGREMPRAVLYYFLSRKTLLFQDSHMCIMKYLPFLLQP